ncbi:MAG: AraC family transcriptional regulator [Treponema sp.]|nr:AraC family transcriptional regulator [Treponema sp.]
MKRLNLILVRYLLIFLFFAVFMLLLFVPIYRYVTSFTLQNELAYIAGKMERGIAALDSVLTTLNNLVISAGRDSRFLFFKFKVLESGEPYWDEALNPSVLTELRDLLNMPGLSSPLPMDMGILFPDGAAITRQSVFSPRIPVEFYGGFLRCGDLSRQEWADLLVSGRPFIPALPYTSAYYGEYQGLTLSAHWSYAGFPDEIIFFAILPVEETVSLIADRDVAEAGYVRIYDANGKLLLARGEGQGGNFHVLSGRSSAYSFRYEIGVAPSLINEKMRPLRNHIIRFACITTGFVILLSLVFAWRSSMPERAFLDRISSTKIIRSVYGAHKADSLLDLFKGLKRIYREAAESITEADTRLESSLAVIESQTHLIEAQTIDRMRQALKAGDEAAACMILRNCAASLPKPEDPLIAGLLAGMLSAMIREVEADYSGLVSPLDLPEYVPGGQEELFERQFPGCFSRICEHARAYKERDISTLAREVLHYINEHLYDPTLYITKVADHFSISAPTLQKQMKQSTGQTFLGYVEKRRLDRACDLLSNSRKSVTEIAAACGFSRVSTFSRAFKQFYGFSPSKLQTRGSGLPPAS